MALIMWGFSASLFTTLKSIPPFETISCVFATSFILACIRLSLSKRWHLIAKTPLKFWGFGILGIYLANVCFVLALGHAPPENVELISYTWPIMALLWASLVLKNQIKTIHFFGSFLAFIGLYLLLAEPSLTFSIHYWRGYLLTIGYALCWSIYVVCTKKYPTIPNEMIGLYCGIGAVCSCLLHLKTEHFILPSPKEWGLMVLIGLTGQGMAYWLWAHSIKYGHYYLLCTLSYFTPCLSIMLLIRFGLTQTREGLWPATVFICSGALLCMMNASLLKKLLYKLPSRPSR